MKRTLIIASLLVGLAPAAFAQGPTEPLTIASGGAAHAFQVEIADSKEEQAKGFGGRASVAADHGMLFDFRATPQGAEPALTMKGVSIPLDMVFIGRDGTILGIADNVRPGTLRLVTPGVPSSAVLEIPGGRAAALKIKPGDKIKHKLFGNGG